MAVLWEVFEEGELKHSVLKYNLLKEFCIPIWGFTSPIVFKSEDEPFKLQIASGSPLDIIEIYDIQGAKMQSLSDNNKGKCFLKRFMFLS